MCVKSWGYNKQRRRQQSLLIMEDSISVFFCCGFPFVQLVLGAGGSPLSDSSKCDISASEWEESSFYLCLKISHTHYHLTACVWGGGKFHQATPHPPKKPKLELHRAIYVILKNSLTLTTWLFSWSDSFSFSSSSSFSFLHTMASVSYSLRHRLCLSDKLARRTTFLWTQVEFPVRKSS